LTKRRRRKWTEGENVLKVERTIERLKEKAVTLVAVSHAGGQKKDEKEKKKKKKKKKEKRK